MERRFTPCRAHPIKIEQRDGKQSIITGYASVFYEPGADGSEYQLYDDLVERVMPGAFDRAIRDGHDCRALFNHDVNCLLGRTAAGTCRLSVDKFGLRYEIDVPDTQAGRDCVVSVQRGDLTGSSFSFTPTAVTWREEQDLLIREIGDVELYDVGPVTFPAYTATTAGMRSAAGDTVEARKAADSWKLARAGQLAAALTSYQTRARSVEISTGAR